jgi:DNA adenine methylase
MSVELHPVSCCSPIAPYIGGKRILAPQISEILSHIPHAIYAEAFIGMGGIFFRRTLRPKAEIINDRSRDVANLFRILQRHYQQFLDTLKWQLSTRSEFERLVKIEPETLTDLERAARFIYLQRTAFSGKVAGRSFGVSPSEPSQFNLTKLVPMLEAVHERLAGVTIENLDWSEFIARYDRPATLFYLDPPYYGCENDYGKNMFGRSDFGRMAEHLAAIEGKFVLSLNDHPDIREIFKDFRLRPVKVNYSIGNADGKEFSELLISNCEAVNSFQQERLF